MGIRSAHLISNYIWEITMTVYILHFESNLHRAKHYVGYTKEDTIERRMHEHRSGHGSPLVKAVLAAGIEIQIARVWDNEHGGTRELEHKIKNSHHTNNFCPICCGLKRKIVRKL
jgi:hypothetical protein